MGAPLRLYRPSPPSTTLFCQLLCHVLDGMNRPSQRKMQPTGSKTLKKIDVFRNNFYFHIICSHRIPHETANRFYFPRTTFVIDCAKNFSCNLTTLLEVLISSFWREFPDSETRCRRIPIGLFPISSLAFRIAPEA